MEEPPVLRRAVYKQSKNALDHGLSGSSICSAYSHKKVTLIPSPAFCFPFSVFKRILVPPSFLRNKYRLCSSTSGAFGISGSSDTFLSPEKEVDPPPVSENNPRHWMGDRFVCGNL